MSMKNLPLYQKLKLIPIRCTEAMKLFSDILKTIDRRIFGLSALIGNAFHRFITCKEMFDPNVLHTVTLTLRC